MYATEDARQLGALLRISEDVDIVGDVTVSVDEPSELLAWADALTDPAGLAWRAVDSERRYVHVTAAHHHHPIHGMVTVVLRCDRHRPFWDALLGHDLEPGDECAVTVAAMSHAWATGSP
jgi:hypothetical protein